MLRLARTIVFNLAALALVACVGWGMFQTPQWQWPSAVVALAAACLCAFVGNLEQFESFRASAAGIEAKTREFQRTAEVTLKQLQEIASSLAAVVIDEIAASGRLGGSGTPSEKDDRKRAILGALETIGVSADRLREVEAADKKWALIDYGLGLHAELRVLSGDFAMRVDNLWATARRREAYHPTPREVRELVASSAVDLPETVSEMLTAFEHFEVTGRHKSPELWARRGSWRY